MRRLLFITVLILSIAILAGFAYIRNSPWMYSHFNKASQDAGSRSMNMPDSLRNKKYYNASLSLNIDSIVVIKHVREMYVYHAGKLQKIYRIALGDAPVGHKHFEGDEKTPEGLYYINGKNPNSSCHKNLGISYPNGADRAYAARYHKATGGDIKIHGIVNGQGYVGKAHLLHDWTNGCVAITDNEIDELYQYTSMGIPVFITP